MTEVGVLRPPEGERGRRSWARAVFSASLLAAGVAGCSGSDGAPSGADDDIFRVALLTSGPVSDAGWYAGAYEGLLAIEDSLGADVSHQETRTPAEFDEAFVAYGSDGYDLVFAHGFEYQDAAIRAGEQFPDMTIIVSGGGRVSDNVIPLIFRLEEASYLAGMVAGATTTSGTVGMVGGVEIPPAKGTFDAFRAGATSVRDDVRVIEAFIGSWNDVAAAKEAAVAQLRAGADLLVHNTDAASFGVFQAVREARASGREVWAFGMNSDQNDIAPDAILGSAVIRIPESILTTARRYKEGTLGSDPVISTLASGGIDFVFNPDLLGTVPEGLVEQVDSARVGIVEGRLAIPRIRFLESDPPS